MAEDGNMFRKAGEIAGQWGNILIAGTGNVLRWFSTQGVEMLGDGFKLVTDFGGKAINNFMGLFNGGNKNNANDVSLEPVTKAVGNSANAVKTQITSMLPPETPFINETKERTR
jgi:hypothetical protein